MALVAEASHNWYLISHAVMSQVFEPGHISEFPPEYPRKQFTAHHPSKWCTLQTAVTHLLLKVPGGLQEICQFSWFNL